MSGSRGPDPAGGSVPSASIETLRRRAAMLAGIRAFFAARGVMEVETPLLCAAGTVDEHLDPVPVECAVPGSAAPRRRWLVTSPEHAMKRLLAAGSGPIYQVARAFRDGERGRLHNGEFTILEWYRPGYDAAGLMDEVEELVAELLAAQGRAPPRPFERITYAEAFRRALGVDPHRADVAGLRRLAGGGSGERDDLLDVLLATRVQGTLGAGGRPCFVTGYPASQAAAAVVRGSDPPVAERFELVAGGVELANGWQELLDAGEQRRRFEEANRRRLARGKASLPVDERLLAALEAGLPPCAGVALGVDRLVMAALGLASIDEAIAFPFERA